MARKGDRFYAVIYEGIDPITGRERRRWHPAGTDRSAAEEIAKELADRRCRDGHERGSLTLAVFPTQRWLPSKQLALRVSTYDSYRRIIDLHVIPYIGRIPLRHLRPGHFERLYAELLDDGRADGAGGLQNKSVVEVHMVLRRALDDAVRRGLLLANPLQIAHAPKRRPLSTNTSSVWNAQQLRTFLTSTSTHRSHAALWVTANTGMRRGEVLGLRWGDVDFDTACLSVTRSLVSVGYEIHGPAASPALLAAASTSTPPPSRSCAVGVSNAPTKILSSIAMTSTPAYSAGPTARPRTRISCRTRSSGWSRAPGSPHPLPRLCRPPGYADPGGELLSCGGERAGTVGSGKETVAGTSRVMPTTSSPSGRQTKQRLARSA